MKGTDIGLIITAVGGLVAAFSAIRATSAQKIAAKGRLELEGMQVSMDSFMKSNAELRIDNTQAKKDLSDERKARELSDEKLERLYEEFRAYKRTSERMVRELHQQIRALGGTPG